MLTTITKADSLKKAKPSELIQIITRANRVYVRCQLNIEQDTIVPVAKKHIIDNLETYAEVTPDAMFEFDTHLIGNVDSIVVGALILNVRD